MNGGPRTNKEGNGASPLSWSQRGLLGGGPEVADVWLFRVAGSHSGDLVAELEANDHHAKGVDIPVEDVRGVIVGQVDREQG